VLPKEAWLLPVGGIAPEVMPAYLAAGASGFGLGSALYRPGLRPEVIARHAAAFVTAYRKFKRSDATGPIG
jgi:2-dehydro-3-deoxyphosphogalactonate aldolase